MKCSFWYWCQMCANTKVHIGMRLCNSASLSLHRCACKHFLVMMVAKKCFQCKNRGSQLEVVDHCFKESCFALHLQWQVFKECLCQLCTSPELHLFSLQNSSSSIRFDEDHDQISIGLRTIFPCTLFSHTTGGLFTKLCWIADIEGEALASTAFLWDIM